MLASTEFLFRIERDPAGTAPQTPYRISDVALASRLSFFLWSSVPDDELLDVAIAGRLSQPEVLERQVRRMLADRRADALVTNFASQWLYLRNLAAVNPDARQFTDFDDNLRQAFRRETELFVESIVREDRNVLDLLRANYTFVNERLARHYGIPNVYGSRFRRVSLAETSERGGLLGHGSILTVTSYANRTSPVLRGKWVLENIVGTPPPPPPPNVPTLKDTDSRGPRAVDARAHGPAPRQPGVRQLPPADGPGRPLAGELRRHRPLARPHRVGRRGGRGGRPARRLDVHRHERAARRAGAPARRLRRHADREAADLRPGPRPGLLRRAGGAQDRPRRRRRRTIVSRRSCSASSRASRFR